MKRCTESSILQLYSILDLSAAFPPSSLIGDTVPRAAPVSHYSHWWFSNRLLSFARHCALTRSLPLATASIHLPPTAWTALISSSCSSECMHSHDLCSPISLVMCTITDLARIGFLPTVNRSIFSPLFFFFLLDWSISSIFFPPSSLLLKQDLYSFQPASPWFNFAAPIFSL